jgi:hypothetical protein
MLFEVEIPASIKTEDLEKALQSTGMTLSLRAMEEDVL